jgi:hypothetical protein
MRMSFERQMQIIAYAIFQPCIGKRGVEWTFAAAFWHFCFFESYHFYSSLSLLYFLHKIFGGETRRFTCGRNRL